MSIAAKNFEIAIKDSEDLLECYDSINKENPNNAPEVLKRASLILILTAWETYVEDRVTEIFDKSYGMLKGSRLGDFVECKISEELRRFNNPDSQKTKKIFMEFAGVDITEKWSWPNFDSKTVRATLDSWIKKRGEAVHRSRVEQSGPHIVKREELDKCLRFFKELVGATESALD
ncbi:hypothetical protein U27_05662 [Candidatus Vecturithrix granuli]|uniref:RiboL-PSP-HEPN domain-containing protein n=1 Tax=Vecturithrix granuli TaxID=1499967 RepID=A0A081C283_VECG1|nr:hypothetical protein U27_05662 [Candidatus Vecturithrix granuli]